MGECSASVHDRLLNTYRQPSVCQLVGVSTCNPQTFVGLLQASTGRSLMSLRAPAVWLVSLLSSSVAAASMVVNDYFDFRSGADSVNSPQKVRHCAVIAHLCCRCAGGAVYGTFSKFQWHYECYCVVQPLPRGLVTPDGALLFGFVLYIGVLLATCFMVSVPCCFQPHVRHALGPNPARDLDVMVTWHDSTAECLQSQPLLRTVIALSAAATLLYTPLLKRLTGIKNATVAAVITASPIAGALAAGAVSLLPVYTIWKSAIAHHAINLTMQHQQSQHQHQQWCPPCAMQGRAGIARLIPLCTFLFMGLMYREVMYHRPLGLCAPCQFIQSAN